MGLFICHSSFACLNLAPRYTSAAVVSLLMLLEMVIGPFWVWLGTGEWPSLVMIAGAAFVTVVLVLHIMRTQILTKMVDDNQQSMSIGQWVGPDRVELRQLASGVSGSQARSEA